MNLWSVIFDVTTVIVLGCHKLCSYKMVNLSVNVVCSDCSFGCSPVSLPLLGPPNSLRHNSSEIRPTNNCMIAYKCSSERKTHISLTLNHKLKMIKLSEEGMSTVKTGWKLGLLWVSKVVNAKENFLKEIKKHYSSEHKNKKKVRQPYCW